MKIIRRRVEAGALWLIAGGLVLGGCASAIYVPANDPVLGVCRDVSGLALGAVDTLIDSANDTDPTGSSGSASPLASATRTQILADATVLTRDAGTLPPLRIAFADDLRSAATELTFAAQTDNGYVANQTARQTDSDVGAVLGDCSRFRAGPPPKSTGSWDWRVFYLAVGSWAMSIPAAALLLAKAQRRVERHRRLTGTQIAAESLLGPVAMLAALLQLLARAMDNAVLTPQERKQDHLDELNKQSRELEAQLKDDDGKDTRE